MGQSTPTTTMAFDTFQERYREFKAELHPVEQRWFDRLVEGARRHSNAINRRPHLDFERPVMLAMMMECLRELDETRDELEATRLQLREACRAMEERGMLQRRMRRSFAEQALWGQRRLAA
ncbi:MAG: hypothetical protein ACPGQL_01025 [Thermoplasmatota archaeon]